jgi:hypothetical protein
LGQIEVVFFDVGGPRGSVAANQAGVHPDHCLYVGEGQRKVNGAVAAGMPAILKPVP